MSVTDRRRSRVTIIGVAAIAAVVAATGIGIAIATHEQGNSVHQQAPSASGCTLLRPRLVAAASRGQSVIEAVGHLTGVVRTVELTPFRQMRLTDIHNLSGTHLPATALGWIPTTPYPAPAPADAPGLWAPDGRLVAIVTPSTVARTALGPVLSVAPIIGDNVILSSASCWADPALSTAPFTGPLQEVPGSNSYQTAQQQGGFHTYPLAKLRQLVA